MSNDYTLVGNLNNSNPGQQSLQLLPQRTHIPPQFHQGPPPQMFQPPAQNFDKYDMIKKYLSETDADDSDDDDENSDDESEDGCNCGNYIHMYGILILIVLIVILWFVFKIRKELTSMYEEI